MLALWKEALCHLYLNPPNMINIYHINEQKASVGKITNTKNAIMKHASTMTPIIRDGMILLKLNRTRLEATIIVSKQPAQKPMQKIFAVR
jgi:hypothetical protein